MRNLGPVPVSFLERNVEPWAPYWPNSNVLVRVVFEAFESPFNSSAGSTPLFALWPSATIVA